MSLAEILQPSSDVDVRFTCQCGRVLESMCPACSARSLVVASAKRRAALITRLDRERGFSYDDYETALSHAIRRLVVVGTLRHVIWGRRGGIISQAESEPAERAPFDADDEDWFIADGATWDPIFAFIDACYANTRRARQARERIDALLPDGHAEAQRIFVQHEKLLGVEADRYKRKITTARLNVNRAGPIEPATVAPPIPDSTPAEPTVDLPPTAQPTAPEVTP